MKLCCHVPLDLQLIGCNLSLQTVHTARLHLLKTTPDSTVWNHKHSVLMMAVTACSTHCLFISYKLIQQLSTVQVTNHHCMSITHHSCNVLIWQSIKICVYAIIKLNFCIFCRNTKKNKGQKLDMH